MATGSNIRTYFQGTWHTGDVPIMSAADHGAWLGTTVFDGARLFEGGEMGIVPKPGATRFAICLEEIPMPPAESSTTLTTTRVRRPVLADNVTNAKAGCLYPNNARMMAEARAKGFANALVCDAVGNVAETASANVFMVRDGEVFTPLANGSFLSGITHARHIANLRANDVTVHETVLTLEDFHAADEVFLSGNMTKVTPVLAFDDTPATRLAR